MFSALMKWMQANKVLPQISETEREALAAGDVWIDGEFFGGNPDFKRMLAYSYHRLPAAEQAFIDGPVERLLNLCDPDAIARSRVVPEEVLALLKREGFIGLNVPKRYGGHEMSTLGKATVMGKVAAYCGTVSAFIVIPNSLGAAELLCHYGTEAQKDHYLPKLARGEYIPCFGLTEPTAGSDAASIRAEGLAFRDADGEVKIRLNFRKRYITLAPVANLISLAFSLQDPQDLLGQGRQPGITVALLHKGTPGLEIGDHHEPIGEPFANGPIIGRDVVIPAANIIGGPGHAGQGWKMLMESLAGGRMVSLPGSAVASARAAAVAAGPYSMVRQQFGMPIGRMDGVEEKIGRMAGLTYLMEGARVFGCSAVDDGIQPPVVSGIMKAYTTELARSVGADAMDVLSGAGVMQGPNNILGRGYCSAPVVITVEGANIMTRTLMTFGQGATRSHPYAFKVVEAVEQGDVGAFRQNLLAWLWQFASGGVRSVWRGLTRGLTVSVPDVHPQTRTYYRRLGWSAMRFGFLTNLALFFVGGQLKQRGKLTGRYADALAWMVLGFGALKRFEAEGRREEDLPLLHYAAQTALAEVQKAFEGIYQNFGGVVGAMLRTLGLPLLSLNPVGRLPDDALGKAAALTLQRDDAQFARLADGVFLPQDESRGMGRLMKAFRLVSAAQPAIDRIQAAQRARQLPRGAAEELARAAAELGVISTAEAALIETAKAARLAAIEVDVFTPEEFRNNGRTEVRAPLPRAANFR